MGKTGKFLKDLRMSKGLTMNEVVLMTGNEIEKTTISRIENDERNISFKAAYYFSAIYGVSLEEIAKKELGGKAKIKKVTIEKKKRGPKPKKAKK